MGGFIKENRKLDSPNGREIGRKRWREERERKPSAEHTHSPTHAHRQTNKWKNPAEEKLLCVALSFILCSRSLKSSQLLFFCFISFSSKHFLDRGNIQSLFLSLFSLEAAKRGLLLLLLLLRFCCQFSSKRIDAARSVSNRPKGEKYSHCFLSLCVYISIWKRQLEIPDLENTISKRKNRVSVYVRDLVEQNGEDLFVCVVNHTRVQYNILYILHCMIFLSWKG